MSRRRFLRAGAAALAMTATWPWRPAGAKAQAGSVKLRGAPQPFDYAGLKEFIAQLLDGPVDVVNRDSLKPYLREAVISRTIYVF